MTVEREPAGSAVDGLEEVREQLRAVPTMSATVIAERVGWTRGITVFKQRVAELGSALLPLDPASRISYVAGDVAQCDFWIPNRVASGVRQVRRPTLMPVLTMVTGYSRWLSALLVPTRTAEDMYAGWWRLIQETWGGAADPGAGRRRGRVRAARLLARKSRRVSADDPSGQVSHGLGASRPAMEISQSIGS